MFYEKSMDWHDGCKEQAKMRVWRIHSDYPMFYQKWFMNDINNLFTYVISEQSSYLKL